MRFRNSNQRHVQGSEIRTPEDESSFSFFNSGSLNWSAYGGVDMILNPLASRSLLEWEAISHRVARGRFIDHLFNISVLVVYTLTRDSLESEADLFFTSICTLKKVPNETSPWLEAILTSESAKELPMLSLTLASLVLEPGVARNQGFFSLLWHIIWSLSIPSSISSPAIDPSFFCFNSST